MAPLIPISTLDRVNGQIHGTAAFPRCNRPRHSLNRRLHGLQTRPGRFGKKEKITCPCRKSNGSSVLQPITQSLYRLRCSNVTGYLKLAVYPVESERAATKFGTEFPCNASSNRQHQQSSASPCAFGIIFDTTVKRASVSAERRRFSFSLQIRIKVKGMYIPDPT